MVEALDSSDEPEVFVQTGTTPDGINWRWESTTGPLTPLELYIHDEQCRDDCAECKGVLAMLDAAGVPYTLKLSGGDDYVSLAFGSKYPLLCRPEAEHHNREVRGSPSVIAFLMQLKFDQLPEAFIPHVEEEWV